MDEKKKTRQWLVECSDPGLVISLAEEFENVLRQIDFDRAIALRDQLSELARELGPDVDQAWRSFRLEVPNDGDRPLTFGSRDAGKTEEKPLKQLLAQAAGRGVGQFTLRGTVLLNQGGPNPETREQYIHDLADGISWSYREELGIFSRPADLPEAMAAHRQQLADDYVADVLHERAHFPEVGYRWIQDSVERIRKALEEVNTRAEAVMLYELSRSNPTDMELGERVRWAALAARLGKEVEKWYTAVDESLDYLYQRVTFIYLVWTECRGWGPARPFLEKRLQALIEQARTIYTADGVAALQLVYDELHKPPWDSLSAWLDRREKDAQEAEEDDSTTLGD